MDESVNVVVRVRPLIGREKLRGGGKYSCGSCIKIDPGTNVLHVSDAIVEASSSKKKKNKNKKKEDPINQKKIKLNREISCSYDKVFGPEDDQEQVFQGSIAESVEAVVNGMNCTVFAYGQTGTGKSYTILGEKGKEGIIPRSVKRLFELLDERSRPDEGDDESEPETDDDNNNKSRIISCTVYCSYLQIYNEQLFDLLQDQKRQFPLKIRTTNVAKQNYVQGLSEIRVSCMNDIAQVLGRGSRNRAIRATEYNEASSRSHAILQLRVETEEQKGGLSESRVVRSAKFNFVDLAGSEKWDILIDMCEERQKELKKINNSLSALGNVVQALGDSERSHIPYRDSKLTHLLQDSLGGNTRTTMICTLSPAADSIEETISTLQFADRVGQVIVQVTVNELVDDSVLLARAQAEIARLKRALRKKSHSSKIAKAHDELLKEVETLRKENQRFKILIRELRAGRATDTTSGGDDDCENQQNEHDEERAIFEAPADAAEDPEEQTGDALALMSPARRRFPAGPQAPGPSDIVEALKDELEQEDDESLLDEDEEQALEEQEKECLDDLNFELGQLRSLRQEREQLEEAMKLLKSKKQMRKTNTPPTKRKKKVKKKAPHPGNNQLKQQEEQRLTFTSKDVGSGLELYQCRVDSWYTVDVVSYDPKSGMHYVRYRDGGSKHWHQMEGRKYKLIAGSETGKMLGSKTLIRDAKSAEAERVEQARIQQVLKNTKTSGAKAMDVYGGLATLWSSSKPNNNNQEVQDKAEISILEKLQAEGLSYNQVTL